MKSSSLRRVLALAVATQSMACRAADSPVPVAPIERVTRIETTAEAPPRPLTPDASSVKAASIALSPALSRPPDRGAYPWLPEAGAAGAVTPEALDHRFVAPEGFARTALASASFGAFLRGLPLSPPGTPVVSFRGDVIRGPEDRNVAAVVAMDIGEHDLQQCADSVIRLHAEWLWAQGRRDASYRTASGAWIPFPRWARGDRPVAEGPALTFRPGAKPDASHASYRRYLDAVFTWANTGSLARDTEPVAPEDLQPGDFVVQPGGPGHAVLILDLARAPDGRRALLLGQGFMPAQSFHVLSSSRDHAWFVVEPGDRGLDTPFWALFPWKTLRRFRPADADLGTSAGGTGTR